MHTGVLSQYREQSHLCYTAFWTASSVKFCPYGKYSKIVANDWSDDKTVYGSAVAQW